MGYASFGGGLTGEELGDFEEAHAHLEEGGGDEGAFRGGEVAGGFGLDDGEHVDGLAGTHEVDLRGLAGFGAAA